MPKISELESLGSIASGDMIPVVEIASSTTKRIAASLLRGQDGIDGRTIFNGSGAPSSGLGQSGDIYIDTTGHTYRVKVGSVWLSPVSMVGPAGTNGTNGVDGTNGTNGTNGLDGRTIHNGSGPPSSGLGQNGDIYIDTTNNVYAVKSGGIWTSPTSMVGPAGSNGAPGTPGADGTSFLPPSGVENDVVGLDGAGGTKNLGQGAEVPAGSADDVVGLDGSGGLKSLGPMPTGGGGLTGALTLGMVDFSESTMAFDHVRMISTSEARNNVCIRVFDDGYYSTSDLFLTVLPKPSTLGTTAYVLVADVDPSFAQVVFGVEEFNSAPDPDEAVTLGYFNAREVSRAWLLVLEDAVREIGIAVV